MRLATHEWGEGDRVAVLIHGLFNFGLVWRATADELVERGYRVVAIDLPGHGYSPRAHIYRQSEFADSVVAAVPHSPELLMGHSLGGYTTRLVGERVAPSRVIHVDPAFRIVGEDDAQNHARREQFRGWIHLSEEGVRRENPRWNDADVHAELLARDLFDPAFLDIMVDASWAQLPDGLAAPSLVLCAEHDSAVESHTHAELRAAGYVVRTVPGTGHSINRDDHAAFMATIADWI